MWVVCFRKGRYGNYGGYKKIRKQKKIYCLRISSSEDGS